MALREEFERQGNWLFRWRSYLPLAIIFPMVLAMSELSETTQAHSPRLAWTLVCLAIALVGLGIRVLTIGHVPQGTSGRNTRTGQIAESLNTTGMYSIVRHPLYVGNFVIWLGIVLFFLNWWLMVMFLLAFWIYYERIMFAEEEFLRAKYDQTFLDWAERTPAFVPRLRQWQKPALSFSLRNALRREYSGLFGIMAAVFALEVCEHLVMGHRPIFEPVWTVFFGFGLVTYLLLRTLNRRTKLLRIEGR